MKELKPMSNSYCKNSLIASETPMKKSFISRKLQTGVRNRLRKVFYANRSASK
jgi:hypothetical protein